MSVQPAIFFGHGNPMNALQDNAYTQAWSAIGAGLRPAAVLCVSAHWFVPALAVTASAKPHTIHDFGGFPRELYEVRYPAPGDAALVSRVQELLAQAHEAMVAAAGRAGKFAGCVSSGADQAADLVRRGVMFVTLGADVGYLRAGIGRDKAAVESLRSGS